MPLFDEGGNTGASYQSGWEAFTGLFSKKRRGKPQGTPEGGGTPNADPDEIPDEEFGGDHHMGTGTYEAKNQEQARALYARLPQGSRADAGAEPPMSTTGKSYYEHNWLTGRNTDPRDQGSSGDPATPNA